MEKPLSVYRHPTLTVLIDDSRSFLDSLAFQLSPQLALKLFHEPLAAIAWLRHMARYAPVRAGYDERLNTLARCNGTTDLDPIHHTVTNRQRFDLPAVLVIDFSMPQMNGVEFCAAVRDLPCKKILLTGQSDESIAIDAFNRKLIDSFIEKRDPDAINRLESEIFRLHEDFFAEHTRALTNLLPRHS